MRDKNIKLPNFLIVGAAKSGTTSLYHYLRNHPAINLPKQKEGRFFSGMPVNFKGPGDEKVNKSIPKTLEEYLSLFDLKPNEKVRGDISPDYLYYSNNTIKNCLSLIGNKLKIIIILRNPIERAFSQYMHFRREGREMLSFEDALKSERIRKQRNWEWAWRYAEVGLYFNQVKAYMENFSQVKIFLFDDLKANPQKVVDEICEFLEVDKFKIEPKIYNKSGIPKDNWKTKFYNKFIRSDNNLKSFLKKIIPEDIRKVLQEKIREEFFEKHLEKPSMKPETKQMLVDYYREDILKLQDLIKRDLTHWLK